jgi:hypothetical protein
MLIGPSVSMNTPVPFRVIVILLPEKGHADVTLKPHFLLNPSAGLGKVPMHNISSS